MNKSESKFYNTSVKMDNALLELLQNKDFKNISIMDVCEKAGVNRSTFYAHYDNTYDLLKETHEKLIKDFFTDIGSAVKLVDVNKLDADELIFISPQIIIPYLTFIKEHAAIFKAYRSGAFSIEETDKILIDTIFVPIYAKNGITDKAVVTYMSKFFLSGTSAVIGEWVKRDCEDDILFICEIIMLCIRPNMKGRRDTLK